MPAHETGCFRYDWETLRKFSSRNACILTTFNFAPMSLIMMLMLLLLMLLLILLLMLLLMLLMLLLMLLLGMLLLLMGMLLLLLSDGSLYR